MDQNTEIAFPKSKNMNIHQWTDEEKVFKQKEQNLQEINDLDISFQTALIHKLSKSVFGPFLKELNEKQFHDNVLNENKLQIFNWDLQRYTAHDLNIISNRNAFFKDYFNLLKKAVTDCDVINLGFLETHLNNISLSCCFIKQVDNSLQKFINIQVLSLSGNYIKDIAGSFLPRKLLFLELFDNFISDLKNLVRHAPNTILHLGLGRNKLTTDSSLHLLSKSRNLKHLKSLDLSDNDICDLPSALNSLQEMPFLTAFSLEGNPCAVIPEYKNEVLISFPKLQYLDFTEVLKKDNKNLSETKSEKILPQIIFQCHRILGLPEPPKDFKNKQVFYIEVNFPLLIKNPIEIEEESVNTPDEQDTKEDNDETASGIEMEKSEKKENDKTHKGKNKKEKSEKEDKEQKKGKKKSYYSGANEYNKKFEKRNVWYKTERVSWSKIMEFPPIFISAPENSLRLIRDTFRSIVPVKLIYMKIAPFSTKPKKEKGKENSKKDKKSKKSAKEENDPNTLELENATEEQQSEIVLKKVTLASFYCDLKSLNWSDETVDFYWADHSEIGKKALRINGSLKAIDYDVSTTPKKVREKQQKIKQIGENEVPKKEFIPNILTCQVGFGLNRY